MHIFITGVAGFLGSNLANYYLDKNFKVSGNDNLVGGDKLNVNKKVNFYQVDCENITELQKIMKGADVVVHAAAYAHEGLSVFSPYLISSNIVGGSAAVFSAAIQNKVKRIVFCSSMARYGEIQIPFKENDRPEPVDPYGVSKLAAEKILINLSKIHGFEYNIAVPHNIIGENQKYDDPFRNVASIMINLMLQNKTPIIYGDGEQKRSFSDVKDCIFCYLNSSCRQKRPDSSLHDIDTLTLLGKQSRYGTRRIHAPLHTHTHTHARTYNTTRAHTTTGPPSVTPPRHHRAPTAGIASASKAQ